MRWGERWGAWILNIEGSYAFVRFLKFRITRSGGNMRPITNIMSAPREQMRASHHTTLSQVIGIVTWGRGDWDPVLWGELRRRWNSPRQCSADTRSGWREEICVKGPNFAWKRERVLLLSTCVLSERLPREWIYQNERSCRLNSSEGSTGHPIWTLLIMIVVWLVEGRQ